MVTVQRNVHFHHARAKVDAVIDGIIMDDVEDVVEDVEGDMGPQGPTHATLVPSKPVGPGPELQQSQVPPSVT